MNRTTLEEVIFLTNKVIYRWKHACNTPNSKIYKSDIEAIFYGYIKKFVIKNRFDFKNVKRCIHVSMDEETRFICNVTVIDLGYHIRDQAALTTLKLALEQVNFNNLIPTADNNALTADDIANLDTISINFKSIESIKF